MRAACRCTRPQRARLRPCSGRECARTAPRTARRRDRLQHHRREHLRDTFRRHPRRRRPSARCRHSRPSAAPRSRETPLHRYACPRSRSTPRREDSPRHTRRSPRAPRARARIERHGDVFGAAALRESGSTHPRWTLSTRHEPRPKRLHALSISRSSAYFGRTGGRSSFWMHDDRSKSMNSSAFCCGVSSGVVQPLGNGTPVLSPAPTCRSLYTTLPQT